MTLATSNPERLELVRSRTAQILGLGTASPAHSIAQQDAALIAQELHITKRWHHALPALYRKSGVNRRGSVLLQSEQTQDEVVTSQRQTFYQPSSPTHPFGPSTSDRMKIYAKEAAPLLVKACIAAIENSSINPSLITHLVTVSCTGFSAPGSDLRLVETLGLSDNVQRTNVGFMGCHGAINAIRVAKAIVEADPQAVVLVGAVELCSIHQQYSDDPQQLVANALFADGAAAMIVGSAAEIASIESSSTEDLTGSYNPDNETIGDWILASSFSQIIPQTSDLMSWNIGDFGFQMSLDPQVPACIESYLYAALSTWLESQSLTVSSIDAWAIHPGGPRIVQASGAALGLSEEQIRPSLSVLANHGNMSSPTVLFILDQLMRDGTTAEAKHAVLLAFGPGLCIEACLLSKA